MLTPLNSEGALSSLVQEMYKRRIPFVANMYSPHDDFGTTLEYWNGSHNVTELMRFERIGLTRNPCGSADCQCMTDGTCGFGNDVIRKFANPTLKERLPEILQWFARFSVSSDQINEMLKIRSDLASVRDKNNLNKTNIQLWYACISVIIFVFPCPSYTSLRACL